jgi:transcriptional regulator with XRE-family HTH domain
MSTTPYAKLLRYLRTERGLAQTEVAKHLALSRASYLALEHGTRELTLREALAVTTLYGVTIDQLMNNSMPDYEKYQMMVRTLLRQAHSDGGHPEEDQTLAAFYTSSTCDLFLKPKNL